MVMALFCLNIAILAQAVSLKMDNVSVKEAMTQLKNKSGYSFVYKVGDLDTKKIITVKAKELNEAIDQILYGQDVVYEVKGKNVIVQKGQARQNTSKDGKKRKALFRGVLSAAVLGDTCLNIRLRQSYGIGVGDHITHRGCRSRQHSCTAAQHQSQSAGQSGKFFRSLFHMLVLS